MAYCVDLRLEPLVEPVGGQVGRGRSAQRDVDSGTPCCQAGDTGRAVEGGKQLRLELAAPAGSSAADASTSGWTR